MKRTKTHTDTTPPIAQQTGIKMRYAMALLLTVIADWLFYSHPVGWTLGGFGFLLLISVFVPRPTEHVPRLLLYLLTIAISALCIRCIYEPNLLTLILLALGFITLSLARRESWQSDTLTWCQRWIDTLTRGWVNSCRIFVKDGLHICSAITGYRTRDRITIWIIPIVLGGLFLLIFAFANPIIGNACISFWSAVSAWSIPLPSFVRILFWIATATLLITLLGHLTGIQRTTSQQHTIPIPDEFNATLEQLLSPATITRALIIFNIIFAIQTALDLFYLWGGATLPTGMTYAQYAHRGAYPLVIAALLAGAFALVAFPTDTDKPSNKINRWLVYLWLGQTLLLVVFSTWRLWLYVDTYALSRLRFMSGIWMRLVAFGLITIIIRIAMKRSSLWLINVNTLMTLIVLYICALAGMDTRIANFNVHQYEKQLGTGNEGLDVEYLKTLGPDALPALHRIVGKCDGYPKADKIREAVYVLEETVATQMSEWRGWTIKNALLNKQMYKYVGRENWTDLNEMEVGRTSAIDNEPETDMTKLHESNSVPEIANDSCIMVEESFAFGKVVGTTSNTVTINEYDFTKDEFNHLEFIVTPKTELGNINALSDLKPGDDVVMDYSVDGNKLIMTTLVLEVPEPIPARINPRVDMPPADIIDLVVTGRVLSLIPGCINIVEQTGINNTKTNRSYQISRTAKLHGYNSLSKLQRGQRISYRVISVNGQLPTITELAAPGHTITHHYSTPESP